MGFENGGWQWRRFGPPFGAIVGTILAIIGWLVFIIFYALFWSKYFDTFQNVILTLASLFIVALVIGLVWLVWIRTRRFGHRLRDESETGTNIPPTAEMNKSFLGPI